MPELPDLVYIEHKLRPLVLDREIREVAVWEPIVLRVGIPGTFAEGLRGTTIRDLHRRGAFLVFEIPPLQLIVHFMLAGYFKADAAAGGRRSPLKRLGKDHCFSVFLESGPKLLYFDPRRMSKVYLMEAGATGGIPGYADEGIDPLTPGFTPEYLRNRIREARRQVRVFLMDKDILSAVGNAYADEILFAAGIHPKTRCNQLDPQQVDRLHGSVVSVLSRAVAAVREADRGIHEEMRNHMQVRNRRGEPCPACGTTIRRTGVLGYDAFFCPKCQPETRKSLVSWDKLP